MTPTSETTSAANYTAGESTTEFKFNFPYLDKSHLVMLDDGSEVDINDPEVATIERDRATGVTTVTLEAGVTGDIVIYRDTPVPGQDGVRAADSQHGSSLAVGDKPSAHQLQYILEEILDAMDEMVGRIEDLEAPG